ncbi:hypothetical protein ACNCBZ_003030 [Escherichia coli]
MGEISVKTGNNARNGGKNSLNRLIRCVCGKKIGPDPRNFNQRVSLGRNDLLIRTFPRGILPPTNVTDKVYRISSFDFINISISFQLIIRKEINIYANTLLKSLSFMASPKDTLIRSFSVNFSVDESVFI